MADPFGKGNAARLEGTPGVAANGVGAGGADEFMGAARDVLPATEANPADGAEGGVAGFPALVPAFAADEGPGGVGRGA